MKSKQHKAYVFAILAILLWSTVASAFKLSLRYVNIELLLFFSAFTSLIVLTLILLFTGKIREVLKLRFKDIRFTILLGSLNPFLYYLVLFTAYDALPAQEAMTLNYTWPLVLSLLSAPLLGQKLTVKSMIALLISFMGIIIIATDGNPASLEFENSKGTLLAIGSSLIWALFWLFNVRNKLNETIKLFFNFLWGSIFIFIFILLTGKFEIPDGYGLGGAVYIGLFEMGITFVLWLKAMQITSRTDKISQLVFLSPFLSLFFIHIFVGEKIHIYTFVGLVLIVSGIILQQYKRKHAKD